MVRVFRSRPIKLPPRVQLCQLELNRLDRQVLIMRTFEVQTRDRGKKKKCRICVWLSYDEWMIIVCRFRLRRCFNFMTFGHVRLLMKHKLCALPMQLSMRMHKQTKLWMSKVRTKQRGKLRDNLKFISIQVDTGCVIIVWIVDSIWSVGKT